MFVMLTTVGSVYLWLWELALFSGVNCRAKAKGNMLAIIEHLTLYMLSDSKPNEEEGACWKAKTKRK